jgi:hypothetical protein
VQSMVHVSRANLEYVGGQTTVNFSSHSELPFPYLAQVILERASPLSYLLNPYSQDVGKQLLLFEEHVIILHADSKQATVANGSGLLRDKRTGVTLYNGQFSNGFRNGQGLN